MRHSSRLFLILALLLSLLVPVAGSAEQTTVASFGKVSLVRDGNNWTADLGKLGKHTFTGTISPLNLQKVITAAELTNMKSLPGRAVLCRLGFQQSKLQLSAKGLELSARLDTQRSLKGLTKLLKIEAPYLDVSARIAPSGFSLRGDLSFARKAVGLTLVPGLGTRIELDKLSLCFDIGTGLPDMDEPFLKKITSISLDIAPVVSVRAECRLQPTKWDPLLNTVSEFSYNLITQEMVVSASMMSRWVNPLGLSLLFKNKEVIVFENAAVAIGWIPGSPVPTKIGYGIENAKIIGLKFGAVVDVAPADGKLAMKYHCEKLSFNDLANMISKGFGKKMPALIPGDLALKNIDILFSPNGGKVGELEIEQGFRFKGEANIGTALKGTIDFYANFDDGLGLSIEVKSSMRDLILKKLEKHKVLRTIIAKITSTLSIKRLALNFKASKSEFGGGIACELMLFGRNYSFDIHGSFNPEELAKIVVEKIKDFCQNELKEAFIKVGQAFVKAGAVAKQWAKDVGVKIRAFAANLRTRMKHAGHSHNFCMDVCVWSYAGDQTRELEYPSNKVFLDFYNSVLTDILKVEGETIEETKKLRESVIAEQWKALCGDIDGNYAEMRRDEEVKKFFTVAKSKTDGLAKYQGYIDESLKNHRNYREVLYRRLLTLDEALDLTVSVVPQNGVKVEARAGNFAGTMGGNSYLCDLSVSFKTKPANLGIRYKALVNQTIAQTSSGFGRGGRRNQEVESFEETGWLENGKLLGVAKEKWLQGITFELTGPDAAQYDIYYSAYISRRGETAVFKNGEFCGTRDKPSTSLGRRGDNSPYALEGIRVWIEQKASAGPLDLAVIVHGRGIGNKEFAAGQFAGTRGQSVPLQDFSVAFKKKSSALGLKYMAHISNVGDTAAIADGAFFGYAGRQNVEGFSITLTGTDAALYDVMYSAHVSNVGDTQTFRNGEFCGFRGRGLAAEGITVWVAKKVPSAQSRIEKLYGKILGRPSDPGGLNGWVSALNNGMKMREIVRAFGKSPEYYSKFVQGKTPAEAARLMYRNFLDRDPENTAVCDSWGRTISASANGYQQAVDGFVNSGEYTSLFGDDGVPIR